MQKYRGLGRFTGALGVVLWGTACGGGGDSGRPEESENPQGRGLVCTGVYRNDRDNISIHFPCNVNPATGNCEFVPIEFHNDITRVSCVADEDEQGRSILPGFSNPDALTDGFCACKDLTAPQEEQDMACASICNQIVLESPNFNNGDPNGPWRCEDVMRSPNGEKPTQECVHGSTVYFNGGPTDYTMQLVGTQTTTGTFDIIVDTVSSSGTGNVDGLMRFSVGDRSLGCPAGCPLTVSELAFVIHPFSVPGIDLVAFEWGGVNMATSGIVSQGVLRGRVFDDGAFVLDAGQGSLVVDYRGDRSGKFAKVLDRNLAGTINFATNSMTLNPVTMSEGEGTVRINTLNGGAVRTPPAPVIATAPVHECQTLTATPVILDSSGTSDLEGGPISYVWEINGAFTSNAPIEQVDLPLGAHDVKLTAADSTQGRASTRLALEVVDTTPPTWGVIETADLTSCDPEVDTHELTIPPVTDGCTGVAEIEAWLHAVDGVPVMPIQMEIGAALLPKGQSTVRWVARDGAGNEAEIFQTMRVGHAIQAFDHLNFQPRVTVRNASGIEGAVASLGTRRSTFGVQTHLAEVLSVGPLFFDNFSVVTGRAASRGAIDVHPGAFIGILQPNSNVDLGVIPWLAEVSGTTFNGPDLVVPPDTVHVLSTSENGTLHLKPRSRLIVDMDEFSARALRLEDRATLELRAPLTRVIVRDRIVNHGTIAGTGPGQQADLFVLGTQVILEKPLEGVSIIAPNAHVMLTPRADNSRVGLLVGGVVEIQPDVTLWCDRISSLPSP